MSNPFRRNKEEDIVEETPAPRHRAVETYSEYLPASVRVPELQRLAIFDDAEPDGPDEDLEFLTALASEVDATARQKRPARAQSQNDKMIDHKDEMQVFRELAPEPDYRTPVSQVIQINDVEIDDLLEDLSTTAAALRRRKAA